MSAMTRAPLLLVAAVGTLALAGCGGGDPKSASSAKDKAFDGALKFARCMREHGVDIPDPQQGGGGAVKIGGPGAGKLRAKPGDAKLKTAEQACGKYLKQGGGRAPDPAERARMQDAFVRYARCMRSKGVNMPDPKVSTGGGGVAFEFRAGSGGAKPDAPKFKTADKACHSILGAVEKGFKNEKAP
jgi:hypothetical protein